MIFGNIFSLNINKITYRFTNQYIQNKVYRKFGIVFLGIWRLGVVLMRFYPFLTQSWLLSGKYVLWISIINISHRSTDNESAKGSIYSVSEGFSTTFRRELILTVPSLVLDLVNVKRKILMKEWAWLSSDFSHFHILWEGAVGIPLKQAWLP